eukprot:3823916-Rhodomonas_salina.5
MSGTGVATSLRARCEIPAPGHDSPEEGPVCSYAYHSSVSTDVGVPPVLACANLIALPVLMCACAATVRAAHQHVGTALRRGTLPAYAPPMPCPDDTKGSEMVDVPDNSGPGTSRYLPRVVSCDVQYCLSAVLN